MAALLIWRSWPLPDVRVAKRLGLAHQRGAPSSLLAAPLLWARGEVSEVTEMNEVSFSS